jgi:hypothetical protein
MQLNSTIKILPPPSSDNQGNIITPQEIVLDSLKIVFIDNTFTKQVNASIVGLPIQIPIWSGKEYEDIGDWTKSQAYEKINNLLGDNPAQYLRSLYPKTLEEHPNQPGTVLSKMIKSVGIKMTDTCSCKRHALKMNEMGNDWCESNIDTIVGWLKEEAQKRKLPFIEAIGKMIVNRAIKKSRKLLANEPVPENDEDLDSL